MKHRAAVTVAGGVLTALLAGGALTLPLPYVILEPGPTVDTLGRSDGKEVVTVTGADVSTSAGQLRMTTIQVRSDISLADATRSWFDDERALVPRQSIYPPGLSNKQVEQENATAFATSQTSAEVVARREIGRPFEVSFDLDEIGGPSAGLMFTLAIIDKLTPADLTGGHIIAGTGTVDDDGNVGRIGGIPQKLVGAKADGAEIFLVPAGNCAEALDNEVPGLPMAEIATVDDALTALTAIAAGGTPMPCTA
ncbi:PDZ domain-containing protein [Actinoplanes sp. NPDC051494]|uniref:PDZ domain-containing protein n=1 Tax=Actinoplanes sp. NPDC051494 TaxID=3363907 RepID=UPI0037B11DAC